jgi:hypothetical protein
MWKLGAFQNWNQEAGAPCDSIEQSLGVLAGAHIPTGHDLGQTGLFG